MCGLRRQRVIFLASEGPFLVASNCPGKVSTTLATSVPPTRANIDDSFSDGDSQGFPADVLQPGDGISSEERLQLVERIAGSEAFQKSNRLPSLLRYLADCTLRHDRAGLTEQAIGRAVFGKPKDFHPAEDSSVRVYMRQLRLRIHEYYQNAGLEERVVIEIPKGGYALAFHLRQVPVAGQEVVDAASANPGAPSRVNTQLKRRVWLWLPWVLVAISLFLAVAEWYRGSRIEKASAPAWPLNQVLQPGRETTMVLADASYILRLLGDGQVPLDAYADHHYADHLIPPEATEGELRVFHYLQYSQITSMADARAAFAMSSLAGSLKGNIVIRSAKELNGNILSNGSFIFIGAQSSNPWVILYRDRVNFRLTETGFSGRRYIQNVSPRPGEQEAYFISEGTGHSGEDYATIALVPGMGEQSDALLLQGLRLEGTEAAIRFLSSTSGRNEMVERLKAANGGTLPHYFEVLLHAHSVGGSPASVDCVAARPLSVGRK